MGSEGGGKSASIAYTLIETAKLNGVDPQAWLSDTLASTSVLRALIKKGLIEEHPAGPRTEVWREDKTGRRFTLTITGAGLGALDAGPAKPSPKRPRKRPGNALPSGAPRGKAETILALLERPEGAPLADLERATGWQPHSIRAALTGLRKRGITITRSKDDGVTIYRAESA